MKKRTFQFYLTKREKIGSLVLMIVIATFFLAAKPLISPTKKISFPLRESSPTDRLYQNEKYGFKFWYPSNWQVEEWNIEEATKLNKSWPDGSILYQGRFFNPSADSEEAGHFEVLIWENKSQAPISSWLTWFRHEDLDLLNLPKEENFSLAGRSAIRYLQQKTSRKKPLLYFFIGKDDKILELIQEREDLTGSQATAGAKLGSSLYDRILQSFQFVVQ